MVVGFTSKSIDKNRDLSALEKSEFSGVINLDI